MKRIYEKEPIEINEKQKVLENKEELVKKHIAVEILLYMLIGKSSRLYQKLYNQGLIITQPDLDYEFSKQYAHITISGQSSNPEKLAEELKKEIKELQQTGNDVSIVAKMFMGDYFKGINSFDYIEKHGQVSKEYTEEILKEVFEESKMVLSIVKGKM